MIVGQAVLWLALVVFFLAIEAATVALLTIWFAIGAVVALLISFFCDVIAVQIVVFFVVSIAMFAIFYPAAQKHLQSKAKTNIDAMIGKKAIVTEAIDNIRATGAVKVDSQIWTARSVDDSNIEKETLVEIVRIEGVKAIVNYPHLKEGACENDSFVLKENEEEKEKL